jgi:hypothetical protein
MLKYTWVNQAVIVEDIVELGPKYQHVLGSIGHSCAIWHPHGHIETNITYPINIPVWFYLNGP